MMPGRFNRGFEKRCMEVIREAEVAESPPTREGLPGASYRKRCTPSSSKGALLASLIGRA